MPKNLFDDLPAGRAEELVEVLAAGPDVRIERIVSHGQASAPGFWYDQVQDEWVVLLQGGAVVRFEGEAAIALQPGDHLHIPAHRRHRVEWTAPQEATVWLAVHYGPLI